MEKFTKVVNGVRVECSEEETAQILEKRKQAEKEIQEELKVAYKQARKKEYPSIGDQLDMLWHAMDKGEIPKAQKWFEAIKAVKESHPKP